MTETALGLRRLGRPHARARVAAAALAGLGVVAGSAAVGLWLAPRVLAVVAAWLAVGAALAGACWAAWRAGRTVDPRALGRLVESAAGARDGSVMGALPGAAPAPAGASGALAALADRRAAAVVRDSAPRVGRLLARGTRRALAGGAAVAAAGAALFVTASSARGGGGPAFWHPLRTLVDARAPVRLSVDRHAVRRGDSVSVTIAAPAAVRATLWTRGPGEPWRPAPVVLDSLGRGSRRVGPLLADLYLRATSGARRSGEQRVAVSLPAFLADLDVTAHFPAYLERNDEPLAPGPDTIPLPAGTALVTSGVASVPLAAAAWTRSGGAAATLAASGPRFHGRFVPAGSGVWRLDVRPLDGSPLEGEPTLLALRVVPDSAPVVVVPVPARDTTMPLSLRQPLVIDARDDHEVTRVELVSWRVSQTGRIGPEVRQAVPVTAGNDRVLIQGELDARERGLLPGDTLRLRVEAWDNAPAPHRGRSAELALRLLTLEELRAAARARVRDLASAGDSLAAAAADLSRRTADLAQERPRESAGGAGRRTAGADAGALPFEASQRAATIAQQQAAVEQRARELAEAVERVARAAQQAGITDTAFQARLAEVQRLLQQALTPELAQTLRELRDALGKLDPDAMRRALEHLSEAQQQFREALERSRELFRRAAIEGVLQALAADAASLRQAQGEWNRDAAPHPDSGSAARERGLAGRTDSLQRALAQAAKDAAEEVAATGQGSLAKPQAATAQAHGAMQRAAAAADQRDAGQARSEGAAAEAALAAAADELRARRDSLTQAWRQETLDALDRALSETAALAERQRHLADSLRHGSGGAPERSAQASVEEGTEAIDRQIRAAAGRNALVSPELERALGFARHQMRAARQELESAQPNLEQAATLADESVDALDATAYALVKSRNDVSGSQSGSGFAEAMERLAQLARQQGSLNGKAQGLLELPGAGGQAMLDQLRALAAQQRALADQLDRLHAEGATPGADRFGAEARDLARQLDAGRLDAQTIQRQERLYHRLLDAGRTLSSDTPDEQRERESRPASGDSVHVPAELAPGATGAGPRLRYPTWDELKALTPDERRLVLEYFRRLNAPAPAANR